MGTLFAFTIVTLSVAIRARYVTGQGIPKWRLIVPSALVVIGSLLIAVPFYYKAHWGIILAGAAVFVAGTGAFYTLPRCVWLPVARLLGLPFERRLRAVLQFSDSDQGDPYWSVLKERLSLQTNVETWWNGLVELSEQLVKHSLEPALNCAHHRVFTPKTFMVPLNPVLPCLGVLANIFLIGEISFALEAAARAETLYPKNWAFSSITSSAPPFFLREGLLLELEINGM